MPIYEYGCRNCEHKLDALQKVADPPLVDCPACGEPQLKRLLSAPRFRLKGSGWYETDFKKDKQRNIAGEREPSKTDDKSADKSADKTSDKPKADKAESKPKPASASPNKPA